MDQRDYSASLEVETGFHYPLGCHMASTPTTGTCLHRLPEAQPREMTACQCSGVSFETIARAVYVEGQSMEEACRRTGCGQTCGACVPDLKRYLARLAE
jgi:NAD(P)H-nitrite reductase large subunit